MTVSFSFIWSINANSCYQTQVFIILHLTYLLTARLPMLSPAADFAEPRPPHHIPPPPDSVRGVFRPTAPPPTPIS